MLHKGNWKAITYQAGHPSSKVYVQEENNQDSINTSQDLRSKERGNVYLIFSGFAGLKLKAERHSFLSSTLLRVPMANSNHMVAQSTGISPLTKDLESVKWLPIFSPRISFTYIPCEPYVWKHITYKLYAFNSYFLIFKKLSHIIICPSDTIPIRIELWF